MRKILFYLKSLKDETAREGIVLKLAAEGGDYCALGLKKTSKEILIESILGIQKSYEAKLRHALQNERFNKIQLVYHLFAKRGWFGPDAIAGNVHLFDEFRKGTTLGFYPLSLSERKQYVTLELLIWEMYGFSRDFMRFLYRQNLNQVIEETGDLDFSNYMRAIIRSNPNLSEEERDELQDELAVATSDDSKYDFYRLLLVMLGILRPATAPPGRLEPLFIKLQRAMQEGGALLHAL